MRMKAMGRSAVTALPLILALFAVSRGNSRVAVENESQEKEIARGRYLVEEVAKCGECHTPRNAQGELIRSAWLQGAPIWIMPVIPNPNWAPNAPPLVGLGSYTPEEAERVLEQGTGPQGETLRPPMHIYHMTHEDAQAIIAYLNSLPRPVR
jgi:mono/diheme cytochrome c family protein